MVVVKESIQSNADAQAYIEPYKLYCDLDRQLSAYFERGYSKKA
jgi:hypothetical protein